MLAYRPAVRIASALVGGRSDRSGRGDGPWRRVRVLVNPFFRMDPENIQVASLAILIFPG